jgi:hypothetical protein
MKLQIITQDAEKIEGYTQVQCFGTQLDLSSISDNECENILAGDVLDMYPIDTVGQVIQQLVKKLRIGGEIVLGGTECRVLAKHIVNGMITEQQASQIIAGKKSLLSVEIIKNALKTLGLNVLTTSISGIHCEVKAKRG